MRKVFILSLIFALSGILPAFAGETTRSEGETLLTLSATESQEVSQDRLRASLRIRAEGKDPADVQRSINSAMGKAVSYAKRRSGLDVETGHYNVHPRYTHRPRDGGNGRERVLDGWEGSQSLMLESDNTQTVTQTAGKIQEMGFAMNGLNFYVSPEKAERVRDSLLEKAVIKVKAKAERVASALGKNTVEVAKLQIGGNPDQPRPYRMMAMAETSNAKMPDPVAEAGEQNITLTLSADVLIK